MFVTVYAYETAEEYAGHVTRRPLFMVLGGWVKFCVTFCPMFWKKWPRVHFTKGSFKFTGTETCIKTFQSEWEIMKFTIAYIFMSQKFVSGSI